MALKYLQTLLTAEAIEAQRRQYGRSWALPPAPDADPLTEDEVRFIAARDSFYIATVTSGGWPYIQHRGGPPGFLRVLDPRRLAFADASGNRQLITTGNLSHDGRASLFLMDYRARERLKVIGLARTVDPTTDAALTSAVAHPAFAGRTERIVVIDVLSFDWNCPKYITPRYTEAEVEARLEPLRKRVLDLEARLAASA